MRLDRRHLDARDAALSQGLEPADLRAVRDHPARERRGAAPAFRLHGSRLSLKTQADKGIKRDAVWISKFMELGKGTWSDQPGDLEALRHSFLQHLERYDRIFTLRTIGRGQSWHYELLEIPKAILALASGGELEMRLASKQTPKPGYCHVRDRDGALLFQLYFDAGTERKLQIKSLRASACVLHAEWQFTVPQV